MSRPPSPRPRPRHPVVVVVVLAAACAVTVVLGVRSDPLLTSTGRAAAAPSPERSTAASPPTTAAPPAPWGTTNPGPATAGVTWVTSPGELEVGGTLRGYLLSRPTETSATKLPVLVELQGCCVSVSEEEARSGFLTVTGPAILVYPSGVDESWNAGTCCHTAQAAAVDDVGFLSTLVAHVLATQPDANPAAVYLAGYSNGGKMALRLACARPDLFAAVAVYGAVNAEPCAAPRPVRLLELAGALDPEVTIGPGLTGPVVDGYPTPSVVAQVDVYRAADGCAATSTMRARGALTTTTWPTCEGGRCVALGVYGASDHVWPIGDGISPSAAQAMWTFFRSPAGCGS